MTDDAKPQAAEGLCHCGHGARSHRSVPLEDRRRHCQECHDKRGGLCGVCYHDYRAEPAAPPRNAPLTEEMYPWLTAPPRADGVADAIRTAESATSRLLREQRADRDRQIAELRELLAFAKAEDIKMLTTIAELRVEAAQSHRYTEQIVAAHDKLEAENARLVALIGRCRTLARATGSMVHVCDAMDEILREIDALAAEGEMEATK